MPPSVSRLSLVSGHLQVKDLQLCNCNLGYRVFFYCQEPGCPLHSSQNFYCTKCMDKEEGPRHDHQSKTIESLKQGWIETLQLLADCVTSAGGWFSLHEGLVQVLDANKGPEQTSIAAEIALLLDLEKRVTDFYEKNIKVKSIKDDLQWLRERSSDLKAFNAEYRKLRYLS